MARYVDADKITDEDILFYLGRGFADCAEDVRDLIHNAPTADVAPVVHAHWIPTKCDSPFLVSYKCSICNREVFLTNPNFLLHEYPYCNCGAKMGEAEP